MDYRVPAEHKTPALANATYTGTYGNDLYGDVEVAERDGGLVLKMGPKKATYPMQHRDRDVFLYQPTGEMAAGLSMVTFTVGAEQKAAQVMIENLNIDGQGTFAQAGKVRAARLGANERQAALFLLGAGTNMVPQPQRRVMRPVMQATLGRPLESASFSRHDLRCGISKIQAYLAGISSNIQSPGNGTSRNSSQGKPILENLPPVLLS